MSSWSRRCTPQRFTSSVVLRTSATDGRRPGPSADARAPREGHPLFGTPRFTQMYRRWLKQGDAVFEGPSSLAIAEALNAGSGTVECVVLTHVYRHLSPWWLRLRKMLRRGLRRGNAGGTHVRTPSTPSLNPSVDSRKSRSSGHVRARRCDGHKNCRQRNDLRSCAARRIGRRLVPPSVSGSVSVGTEPRRERPQPGARRRPAPAQGSFTSRFRVPTSEWKREGGCTSNRRTRHSAGACAMALHFECSKSAG